MQHLKKLSLLAAILAVTAMLASCGGSSADKSGSMEHTQKQQEVHHVSARIFQKGAKKTELGTIKFVEREQGDGLRMQVNLTEVRPNATYLVYLYELRACPMNPDAAVEKTRMTIELPNLNSDARGRVISNFVMKGMTIDEVEDTKIVLVRRNPGGGETKVAHGLLTAEPCK